PRVERCDLAPLRLHGNPRGMRSQSGGADRADRKDDECRDDLDQAEAVATAHDAIARASLGSHHSRTLPYADMVNRASASFRTRRTVRFAIRPMPRRS